jgi:hypothetical protein
MGPTCGAACAGLFYVVCSPGPPQAPSLVGWAQQAAGPGALPLRWPLPGTGLAQGPEQGVRRGCTTIPLMNVRSGAPPPPKPAAPLTHLCVRVCRALADLHCWRKGGGGGGWFALQRPGTHLPPTAQHMLLPVGVTATSRLLPGNVYCGLSCPLCKVEPQLADARMAQPVRVTLWCLWRYVWAAPVGLCS